MSESAMGYIPYIGVSCVIILAVTTAAVVVSSTVKIKRSEPTYTLDIGICDESKHLGQNIYLVKCNDKYDVRSFKAENGTLKPSIRGINLSKEQYKQLCDFPFVVKT